MIKILGAILVAGVAAGLMQAPPRLEIVMPADGTYVSDQLVLEARIVPRERRDEVSDVTFFADGKQVCRIPNGPVLKCAWDAGPLIKPHLIRVVATTKSGERLVASTRTREVDFKESVGVQVVQVNASVQDRGGRFVRGLTRDQFRVLEDGRPQTIVYFAAEEAPLEIVVAMDISASMTGALDHLKSAVRQFLAQLKPIDRVTLVAFNDETFVLTPREADPAARGKAIDALTAFGGTTLYDAIIRSLDLLSRQPGRRSLVLFSDGDDQSSQAKFAAVDRALKGSDATLFTVALGRGREQATLRETLEALAEPTGGRVLFAERPQELDRAFSELLNELTNQYLLGYESTNTIRDGAWRSLQVEVPGTRHQIRARQGYFGLAP